jgi:S1-C subfamily serine protease
LGLKKHTISLVMISGAILIAAQAQEKPPQAQDEIDAVVYIQQQYQLDGAKAKRPELWKKLSTWAERDFLGSYATVSSGSGFFIDSKGHVLTNAHVVQIDDPVRLRQNYISDFQKAISREVPDSVLTPEDRFALRTDIAAVLRDAQIELRIWAPRLGYLPAIQSAADNKRDLALLAASTLAATKSIPLALSKTYMVGDEVTSIGFPLGGFFDKLFKDPQASLAKGVVSALRNDAWGIQHTAPLNPGNSGGPLIDSGGKAIGVNVGLITNSNGLFFAIPTSSVRDFLNENGFGAVLAENQELTAAAPSAERDSFDVGDTVVIMSEKGALVLKDGVQIGSIPFIYEMPSKAVKLTIRGKNGERAIILQKKDGLADPVTLNIQLKPASVELTLSSEPSGATVLIDGIAWGKTPLALSLPAGPHVAEFSMEGYSFPDKKLIVEAGKQGSILAKGARRFSYTFSAPLPPGTALKIVGAVDTFVIDDPQQLKLGEGQYTVSVSNPGYLKPVSFSLDTKAASFQIDVASWFETGKLVISGDINHGTFSLDGAPAQAIPDKGICEITAGVSHTLVVERPNYRPFTATVEVGAGESKSLQIPADILPSVQRTRKYLESGILLAGGIGCMVSFGALANRDVATTKNYSPSLGEYAIGYAGLGLLIWGGIDLLIATTIRE